MVITVNFKFISCKIARVEVYFCGNAINKILCCHPVRFLFIEVERKVRINELQHVAGHNGFHRTRKGRLYIIKILAPLENTVFRHHFGFLDIRLPLGLTRQAKAVGTVF